MTGRRVQNQQYGMRHRLVLLAQHTDDLAQFFHQRALVVQAAGGVDQQHVGALGPRAGQRVERQTRGIGVLPAGDHRRAGAIAPDLQLLHRGGAERVAGTHEGALALVAVLLRQFADRGGLAGAIDANHQHDMRFLRGVQHQRLGNRGQNGGNFLGEGGFDLLVGHFLAETGAAEFGDHPRGGIHTQVGGEQQFFQFLQRLIVQASFLEDRGDAFGDLLRAARKTFLQAREETAKCHQAASASRNSFVAPVMRAAISRPGSAGEASRTGAKCSEWPRSPVSVSKATTRPC